MKIKDVEEKVGLDRASIRYYEQEGLLITRRNPLNGYREYDQENIEDLNKIIFLRSVGISIEDIRLYKNGKKALDDIVHVRYQEIENEGRKLDYQKQICSSLTRKENVNFMLLKPDQFQYPDYHEQKNMREGVKRVWILARGIGLIWMLILMSLLLAFAAAVVLPKEIAINFEGNFPVAWSGKWILFLAPLVSVFIAVFVNTLTLNGLYSMNPILLPYADKISGYISVCFVILVLVYQSYVILFAGGFRMDFDLIIDGLCFIFLIGGIILFYIKLKRDQIPWNNKK